MLHTALVRRSTLALLIACAGQASAQSGFTELFGGPLGHEAIGLTPNATAWNVGVRAFAGSEEGHRGMLFQRNANGSALQQTIWMLPERAFLQAMSPAPNGGSYACGSLLPGGAAHQGLLLRSDASGNLLWHRTLPSSVGVQFLALTTLNDGSVLLCGMAEGDSTHAVAVARYTSEGTLVWNSIEPFALNAEAYGIAANSSGFMITGRQENFGGTSDVFFMHFSLDGTLQMSTSWGGIANEEGRALVSSTDGNFVMAGSTRSYGPVDAQGNRRSNLHLIKIDAAGDTLWTRTYGDILRDRHVNAMASAPNGDLLIAGSSSGTATLLNEESAWVARLAPNGNLIWERTYTEGRSAGLRGIVALSDGFVAAGWSFGNDGRRVLMIRRDANGE